MYVYICFFDAYSYRMQMQSHIIECKYIGIAIKAFQATKKANRTHTTS